MNFFKRFQDYFQGICDSFETGRYSSSIFPNLSDVGASREDILKSFFENHLPKRCAIFKGGFLFNLEGNESKQIDLFITNDSTLQFKQFSGNDKNGKSFNFVGGCLAAFSIKSRLNKVGIVDSLENLGSIPQFPDVDKKIMPLLKIDSEFIENLPLKIVFGFSGLSLTKTLEHINNFYNEHNYPTTKKANIIVLNNKFIIIRIGSGGGSTRNGTKIQPNTYYGFDGKFIGAYSLVYILSKIQETSEISNHILLDIGDIVDKMPMD